MTSTRILESEQIERKIQRIARQIAEAFIDADQIHLISIAGNGEPFAHRISEALQSICNAHIETSTLKLKKSAPLEVPIQLSNDLRRLTGEQVVIVDDVLNSGKTLMYAVHHILSAGPARVATAVLVDRIHRSFPIRADFCGLSLSTNLKEHIDVTIGQKWSDSDEAVLTD
tara:strand:- start:1371 stop:1883 length:513 start_codon:yes stop_codon:yes gene_type:complete